MSLAKWRQTVFAAARDNLAKQADSAAAGPVRQLGLVEAAKRLGVSPRTLRSRSWRRKNGVPALKRNGCVFYDAESLDRWRFGIKNATRKKGRR